MPSYDSLSDLLEILDRHVSLLVEQEDIRLFVALPRFLEFLSGDPRIEAVVSDLRHAVVVREQDFNRCDAEMMQEIRNLWSEHRPMFERARDNAHANSEDEIFNADLRFSSFEESLTEKPDAGFPTNGELGRDPSKTSDLLATVRHWLDWCKSPDDAPTVSHLHSNLRVLEQKNEFAYRRFWLDSRNLAGVAYERLRARVGWMAPVPPAGSDLVTHIERALTRSLMSRVVEAIFEGAILSGSEPELQREASAVRREVRLLHSEIRSGLLLRRSAISLMKVFQARCERFESAELRSLARSRHAEAALTLRFARFLFDQGLDPLVDPKIAGLRPDIMVPNSNTPVYVEAKQYSSGNPRAQLQRAVAQVFDTWGRLRATYPLDEAFLVVFRLGGPRVELDEVTNVHGRTLYTRLVDLGKGASTGSKQRDRPVMIAPSELVEWASGGPGPVPRGDRGRRKRA